MCRLVLLDLAPLSCIAAALRRLGFIRVILDPLPPPLSPSLPAFSWQAPRTLQGKYNPNEIKSPERVCYASQVPIRYQQGHTGTHW